MRVLLIVMSTVLLGSLLVVTVLLGPLYQAHQRYQVTVNTGQGGATLVAQAARLLQARLTGERSNQYEMSDALMQRVVGYWKSYCSDGRGGLCTFAIPGGLQCVQFVSAAYWLAGAPLPSIHDAIDFWDAYSSHPGWLRIPAVHLASVGGNAAPRVGDLVVWQGEQYGHIAVVVNYTPPQPGKAGSLEVAQANAPGNKYRDMSRPGNTYTMPVSPQGHISTWPGYTVLGWLRQPSLSVRSPSAAFFASTLPPGMSPEHPYVQMAIDAATSAGIPIGFFVRQIEQESHFDPAARSHAGAQGIAQFMPETAARLGIDPWNPREALPAAAGLMARLTHAFGGDYAKALAAYNAGERTVEQAEQQAAAARLTGKQGSAQDWRTYLPAETRAYLVSILEAS